jgi:hypothetical protein
MSTLKYPVRGKDPMTLCEYANDPEKLCRQIAGDGFKDVDVAGVMHRLSTWAFSDGRNAKKNIARFVTNNLGRAQSDIDSGRAAPYSADDSTYKGGDLSAKVVKRGR